MVPRECRRAAATRASAAATISDSTVEHLTDSFLGLPGAHAIGKNMTPKSSQSPRAGLMGPGRLAGYR
jgi:hypothetical protein